MANRFFVEPPIEKGVCHISGETAHHIINVMRLKLGDSVTLFDGTNHEYIGTISELKKKSVTISIESVIESSREQEIRLTLAVSFPKGDRQKFMIEKLVELGVHAVVPLQTQRSVVNIHAKSTEKMKRWIIEASKQCGRNQLMEINPSISFNNWIDKTTKGLCLIAHPYKASSPLQTVLLQAQHAREVSLTIGPEGGFTSEEIADAQRAGWKTVEIGSTILRIETAALAAAALFRLPSNQDARDATQTD